MVKPMIAEEWKQREEFCLRCETFYTERFDLEFCAWRKDHDCIKVLLRRIEALETAKEV